MTVSSGLLYEIEELVPARGEAILVVPLDSNGDPEWGRSTFGVVGEVGEPATTNLYWEPRTERFRAWDHWLEVVHEGMIDRHIAVPFRSVLFHEIIADHRIALWVGTARHVSDDSAQTRELTKVRKELRGLEKRLQIERECVRGLLKGLVDPQALDRLIAHLDLLVAHAETARVPSTEAVSPTFIAALEETAVKFDAARSAIPGVMAAAFADGAAKLRMVAACFAPSTEASVRPVVDPEVLQDLAHVERILEGHVVGTGDADVSHTEFVIADAVRHLRATLAKLSATA